jgi:negative elongation factor A
MKTYPATGSLNTEISDYDHESRPIFTDMVTELKRLVNKANDLRALPLECQYLNKPALTALVGNQPTPVRHFVLKRKPKSSNLRMELMQKSADAQSSLKKTSAPTVPLRSRGLPRKMTDTTTPLKGIPSRVPSSGGFKTPAQAQSKAATAISRTTPAGRKDGGVKFLEIEDQPLGYAAAKKRKRQQELEEQQKRAAETEQQNIKAGETNEKAAVTPDYAAGLTSVYSSQPATPMPAEISTSLFTTPTTPSITAATAEASPTIVTTVSKKKNSLLSPKRMKFEDDIEEVKLSSSPTKIQQELPVKSVVISPKESIKGETKIVKVTRTLPTLIAQQQNNATPPKSIVLTQTTQSPTIGSSYVTIKAVSAPNSQQSALSHLNIPSNTIVRTVQYVTTQAQAQTSSNLVMSTTKSPPNTVTIQKPTLIAKTNASGKPTILSNIVLTPNMRAQTQQTSQAPGTSYVISSSPSNKIVQRVVVSSGQNISIPTLTTRTAQPTIIQPMQQGTPTKIVQIKTTPTILGMAQNQNQSTIQNIPPLISTQQPTLLNIQNIQNPAQRKTVTLTAQPQTTSSQQGQKFIVPSGGLKGKTIIVSNQNQNQQINLGGRNVILQSVGASGTPIYQQIPISSGKTFNFIKKI